MPTITIAQKPSAAPCTTTQEPAAMPMFRPGDRVEDRESHEVEPSSNYRAIFGGSWGLSV